MCERWSVVKPLGFSLTQVLGQGNVSASGGHSHQEKQCSPEVFHQQEFTGPQDKTFGNNLTDFHW